MIELYLWNTPNGYKIAIALEEMALDHETHWVNIGKGEQFAPEFLKISPNNRIPAIVDDGLSIFESGAILQYLATKTGQFGGNSLAETTKINQWLHWQMGGIGPMFGQAYHFKNHEPRIDYAFTRYRDESLRLIKVLEGQLEGRDYVADAYSIADMAIFPWVKAMRGFEDGILDPYPHVNAWIDRVAARPAVARAMAFEPPRA